MNLPAELRIMIWENLEARLDTYHHVHIHAIRAFSCQDPSFQSKTFDWDPRFPRIGELRPWLWSDQYSRGQYSAGGVFLSTTTPPIHPFLQACFESRELLIKKYKLVYAFGAFINPDRDIIYLVSSTASRSLEYPSDVMQTFVQLLQKNTLMSKIKKFAMEVSYEYPAQTDKWTSSFAGLMKMRLNGVKKLYLVQEHHPTPSLHSAEWSPGNHIMFGVIPLNQNHLHGLSRPPILRRSSEDAWSDAEPTGMPGILYEHVNAWDTVELQKKRHGVWSAADYLNAWRRLTRGWSFRFLDYHTECCNKSIDEHD
jgi:hypothetical protein